MTAIALEDVTVRYGAFTALDGVSLRFDGGAAGLLGANGAGKSTLIKTVLGFNRAAAGSVRVFGKEMPREALAARLLAGYMPEREVSSPRISAVNFLVYCGRLLGMRRADAMERAHAVLNYVGMDESRYRKMETYSTGMLQRVKLAQALIHDPKLLLLDEPTNGLDPRGRIEMLRLIREVSRSRGVAVILSTHLLPDVQHVCDRVLMIHAGKLVCDERIEDLTAPCPGRFAIRLREDSPRFNEAAARAGFKLERTRDGGWQADGGAHASARTLFALAAETGVQVRHIEPLRRNLEEALRTARVEERAHAG